MKLSKHIDLVRCLVVLFLLKSYYLALIYKVHAPLYTTHITTNPAAISHVYLGVPTETPIKALAYMITVHISIMTNVYTNPGSTLALCFCPEIDW